MNNPAERVSAVFSVKGMLEARLETSWALTAISERIKPGMTENDALNIANEVLRSHGHHLSWRSTRIRFGRNTYNLSETASNRDIVLNDNDIFIVDIAPRVDQWEGNAAASFTVGNVQKYRRCISDAAKVFNEVRLQWQSRKITGSQLYDFASQKALQMGWRLNRDVGGNRVSDFPHAAIHSGALADYSDIPSSLRWVLAIHLVDLQDRFGALFSDLLLDNSYYPL